MRERAGERGLGYAQALGQALHVLAHRLALALVQQLAAVVAGELPQQGAVVVVAQAQLALEHMDGGDVAAHGQTHIQRNWARASVLRGAGGGLALWRDLEILLKTAWQALQ